MSSNSDQERRQGQRAPLMTFCPTSFIHGGSRHCGFMLDVSTEGARFRLEEQNQDLHFIDGEELCFDIKTPYGDSCCKGNLCWAEIVDNYYSWGVQFTELSDDERDPLRCLIDSSF